MERVYTLLLSFPLVVFSALVPLVVVYWLLVTLRIVPLELFERDSLRHDHMASTLVSLGFVGVPASFALSVLILFAGAITLAVELLVLRWLPLGLFRVPVGVGVLWGAFALASPIASGVCHAVHRWFHGQRRTLLGEAVEVIGVPDTEGLAQAVLLSDRACRVRLHGKPHGHIPQVGERRVLVKFIVGENAYRSVAENDYCNARAHAKRFTLGREVSPRHRNNGHHV
ncbi:MAG: hypothetical protein L0I84_03575 [Halomonas subglaciescola]|nr:hypothetical protein [Halomonas subglaciescola]